MPDKFTSCMLNNRALLGEQTFDLEIYFVKFTYPGQSPYTLSLSFILSEDEGTEHLHHILASSDDNSFQSHNLARGQNARLFGGRHLIGCHWLCDHGAKLKIAEAWRCVLYLHSLLFVVSYAFYRTGRHT